MRARLRIRGNRRPLHVERGVERRHAGVARRFGSAPCSSRYAAISKWPLMSATSSGVALSPGLGRLTSAPASTSARTAARTALPRREMQRRQAALRADQLVVAIRPRVTPGTSRARGAGRLLRGRRRVPSLRSATVSAFRSAMVDASLPDRRRAPAAARRHRRDRGRRRPSAPSARYAFSLRVDVGAGFDQPASPSRVSAGARRQHQRRRAGRGRRLRVGAGGEQRRDDLRVAALAGQVQRGVPPRRVVARMLAPAASSICASRSIAVGAPPSAARSCRRPARR